MLNCLYRKQAQIPHDTAAPVLQIFMMNFSNNILMTMTKLSVLLSFNKCALNSCAQWTMHTYNFTSVHDNILFMKTHFSQKNKTFASIYVLFQPHCQKYTIHQQTCNSLSCWSFQNCLAYRDSHYVLQKQQTKGVLTKFLSFNRSVALRLEKQKHTYSQ